MPQREGIGGRIAEARTGAGLTREQLAARCACTYHAVRAWEEGSRHPRPGNLRAIALATGKSVQWFYAGPEQEAA